MATIPAEVALDAMVQFEQRALRSQRTKTCAAYWRAGEVAAMRDS